MLLKPLLTILLGMFLTAFQLTGALHAAEAIVLGPDNWESSIPAGKEVDCIYGDHLLRSDRLVAVVASADETRNANLTVKGVGGSLIDLTERDTPSDQLSCYYPHGGAYRITGPIKWPDAMPCEGNSAKLAFALTPPADRVHKLPKCEIAIGYELADGNDYLTLRSLVSNATDAEQSIELADGIRADGEFEFGFNSNLNLWWCQDSYWRQSYGVAVQGDMWRTKDKEVGNRKPRQIQFLHGEGKTVTLKPGETMLLERRLFPAADSMALIAKVASDHKATTGDIEFRVSSTNESVAGATVKAIQNSQVVASGQTDASGQLTASLPQGEYRWVIESAGRKHQDITTKILGDDQLSIDVQLPALGRVEGQISDGSGKVIPARIALFGNSVDDPNFGPDSAVHGVRNLWHTHDGHFEMDVLPGKYEMVVSYGPEYEAVTREIEVKVGEVTEIAERLTRTVDTTGWLSAELHSHSSPSGDNTSSQRGRVLNLLVDHLEFIPCTEHQRISTYAPHLEYFGATQRVLTCCGMELTGSPLPINHQNVFPLVHKANMQDGGGPTIHVNPEVQIERIAMWDSDSDKVVQINHPNIAQMVGDRDLDGVADAGFRKMFSFADVMEVHPLQLIFEENAVGKDGVDGRGNTVKNWMQLLNLGYRIPGVVNTDAHWNYYGSGWLRNYVRSTTDEPAEAKLMDLCHALERGQVVMTNGPFLEVEASAGGATAGPGDDLVAEGSAPRLKVKVQCPNWLDVNRVQVVVNGRFDADHNFLRGRQASGFGNGVVKFEREFELPLDADAHVIVIAAAEERQLGRVYGPEQGAVMPIAISNPIFIDLDGQGFQPNGDTLDMPLPTEPGHRPTHGHDHPHPHH